MNDPFQAAADLPGVSVAALRTRVAIDELFWDRRLRARPDLAASVQVAEARASAALDGAELSLGAGERPDATPMGRVVAAAERVATEVALPGTLIDSAPLQLLARLGAVAGAGFLPDDALGRPRSVATADDPLRLGLLPPVEQVRPRLAGLARLLVGESGAPGVVVAGVVHAELLALRPFEFGSGLVARGMGVATLAARGVDPSGLLAPSVGWVRLGRPAYVTALRAYLSGTPAGLATWLIANADAIDAAVEHTRELLD